MRNAIEFSALTLCRSGHPPGAHARSCARSAALIHRLMISAALAVSTCIAPLADAHADVPKVVIDLYPTSTDATNITNENGVQRVIVELPPPSPPRAIPPPPAPPITTSLLPERGDELAATESDGTEQPAPDGDASTAPVQRDDIELLLLEMRLNSLVLVDAMPAYMSGGSIVMPLRDLSQILDFPIDVEPLAGTANGWFIRENKLFSLNVARGEVVIEGKVMPFDARLVEIHEDDIYVDTRLLSRWFPIDIGFDLSNLLIRLTSREPLPVEQRLAREGKRTIALSTTGGEERNYQELEIPHKLISVPVIDVDMDFTFAKQGDNADTTDTGHSVTMTGDLLYSNAEIFIAGTNNDKFDTLRLRLERKDPDGEALGILPVGIPINDAQMGDVVMPQMSEISRSELGRGILISNIPLDVPTEFDTVTLDGDLPLGWDLELYRNEVLIDFAASQADGRYTFEDVPLLFGVNVLRLVFYGPQGQEREEIQHFRVGPSQVLPGEVHYRFVTNQHDRPFLVRDDNADENLVGERRILLEANTGINKNLSLGSSYVELPFEDGAEQYISVNSIMSFGDVLSKVDLINQVGGGWAASLNAQTTLLGVNIIGEHSHYRNYFSEQIAESTDPQSTSSSLRIEGAIPESVIPILPRLPFAITMKHDRDASGDSTSTLSNRGSLAIGNASITNTSSFTRTVTDGDSSDSMTGSWLLGGRYRALRLSGSIAYQTLPITELQSAGVSGTWNISPKYQASSGFTHTFSETEDTTQYSVGLNMQTDLAAIGLNFDYTSPTDMEANVSVSYALGRDPETGGIVHENQGIAQFGLIGVRVFLDLDVDGQFSEGDELLENVGFMANGGKVPGQTDEFGHALLTGLEAYKTTDLEIDNGTLDDPFWVASPGGVEIVPRPGSFGSVDFPIVTTGEIDGTVYRRWVDKTEEAAGVFIQLVDAEGNIVREIRSAYDGFFLFDFVTPGTYNLRINPKQLSNLGLVADEEHQVEIGGDGTVVTGKQFILSSQSDQGT